MDLSNIVPLYILRHPVKFHKNCSVVKAATNWLKFYCSRVAFLPCFWPTLGQYFTQRLIVPLKMCLMVTMYTCSNIQLLQIFFVLLNSWNTYFCDFLLFAGGVLALFLTITWLSLLLQVCKTIFKCLKQSHLVLPTIYQSVSVISCFLCILYYAACATFPHSHVQHFK